MSANAYYAACFGNEEEACHRFFPGKDVPRGELSMALNFYKFHDPDVVYAQDNSLTKMGDKDQFGSDGSRVYMDGNHVEISSAECLTIEDLAARIRSNEDRLGGVAKIISRLSLKKSEVGFHRRVIDKDGVTCGCHDNFGLHSLESPANLERRLGPILIGHLLTRSVVTGAGLCRDGQFYFSQKMYNPQSLTGHTRSNTMYNFRTDSQTVRVEVRCNDINISDWATRIRLGSTAIALAIAQTPLAESFDVEHLERRGYEELDDFAKRFNRIPLKENGKFKKNADILLALGYQQRMAETFMSDAMSEHAGKQPNELMAIAKELRQYCIDMRKVLRGRAHFSLLADRADWAAKLGLTMRRYERDKERYAALPAAEKRKSKVKQRVLGDEICEMDDLAYDYVRIKEDAAGNRVVDKVGYGYQLRDKKRKFRWTLTPEAVQDAKNPPKGTRAELRGWLIMNLQAIAASWRSVTLRAAGPDKPSVVIELHDVLKTGLTAIEEARVKRAAKRPAKS